MIFDEGLFLDIHHADKSAFLRHFIEEYDVAEDVHWTGNINNEKIALII